MNTTELFKQRKAVDLPSDSVRSLAMAAAAKGISLKKYLENAAGINGVIGTENIQYIYQFSKSDGTEIYSEKGQHTL